MPSSAWSSDVCSSDRSEEHTSELQSQSNLVCRIISSEEHTSELQSQSNLVCRLLLEKKNEVEPRAPSDLARNLDIHTIHLHDLRPGATNPTRQQAIDH